MRTNTNLSGKDVWTYTFVATSDGTFTMDYDVFAAGDKFGLQGIVIHWDGPGGNLNLADAFDPTTSGSFVRALTNGVMYTVGVGSYSNLSADAGTTSAGNFNADLNWKIESVPEPATLGVLAVGLLPCLRRKRAQK
ncbi:PEP-CTERM sorting domain-containing protein [bacterium]|nr:MAG: PEP-CTERM sorting domain-containing protein [bacterium]